jgi:hypothetical protein
MQNPTSLASGSSPIAFPAYTWAAKPAAASSAGQIIRITDVSAGQSGSGGGSLFISNGVRWKPLNGEVVIDGIDTPNDGVANTTENIVTPTSVVIPAGLIGNFDKLKLLLTASKNGASDSCTIRLRWGPLGTVADPVISTITSLAGANQSFGSILVFKRTSATAIQKMGSADSAGGFTGPSLTAFAAATAVSNMDSNAMRLTITAQMTGGTEIPTIQDMQLTLSVSDNA